MLDQSLAGRSPRAKLLPPGLPPRKQGGRSVNEAGGLQVGVFEKVVEFSQLSPTPADGRA
jgi:hypothetical protein